MTILIMQEDIEAWIDQAEEDLAIAKYNIDGNFYDDVCFHAQQCAEKALKAVYIKKFKELRKIHDVQLLAQKVEAPQEIIDIGDILNPYYIVSRYPVSEESKLGKEDAEDAIKKAEKVLVWAKKSI